MDPSDPLDLASALTTDERARRAELRAYLEQEVRPHLAEAWENAHFPEGLVRDFGRRMEGVLGPLGEQGPHDSPESRGRDSSSSEGSARASGESPRPLWYGVIKLELGRVDPSLCSVFSVHYGLCRGAILRFGSPAQQARWLGPLSRFEALGAFGLTEPLAGSAIATEMATTAVRDGDDWVLHGEKRWIGNAPEADVIVVFARTDAGVGAFLVERGAAGLSVETMTGKLAKRAIQNGHVRLDGVRVPESARLPGVRTFRDVATHLAHGRVSVAWEALGIATGAFEIARAYTLERQQFGRPIAGFQLVQDRLVAMTGALASMSALLLQLARLEEADEAALTAERASLAKRVCAEGMRAVVADARALMGGEGLLLHRHVARLFADAEAVYTYEGTHEINTLIVGRAITGIAAFR